MAIDSGAVVIIDNGNGKVTVQGPAGAKAFGSGDEGDHDVGKGSGAAAIVDDGNGSGGGQAMAHHENYDADALDCARTLLLLQANPRQWTPIA